MILIIGSTEDNTLMYFHDFLEKESHKFFFLNQKSLSTEINLFSEYLLFDKKKYWYSDFTGVLNRLSSINASDIQPADKKVILSSYFLCSILNYEFTNVLSRPFQCLSNDSKLFQLSAVKTKSIKIPTSIVMCNLDIKQNLDKYDKAHKRHIVKSLSSIRSIVKEFETSQSLFSQKQSSEPVLFQELIDGNNIRVHVVEDNCFAIRISSNTIDYRYENEIRKFESCELPEEIVNDCISISKQLSLRFTGIDLIEKNNKYYLLEVNPTPGWSYFEMDLNNRLLSQKVTSVLYGK